MTADAMGFARWGYQLYGARILPPETVATMTVPAGAGLAGNGYRYGHGTLLFSQSLGSATPIGTTGSTLGS